MEAQGKIRQAAGDPFTGTEGPSRRASCFRFSRNQVQAREPMTGAQSNGASSFWSPRKRAACLVGSGKPSWEQETLALSRGRDKAHYTFVKGGGAKSHESKAALVNTVQLLLSGPCHTALSQTQRVSEYG